MKAEGIRPPLTWEHADPLSDEDAPRNPREERAEFAKFTAGWPEDMRVEPDGRLTAEFDVPDGESGEQVKTTGYVSPAFRREWRDGSGRVWKNVISHIAVTPRPVHHRQDRFAPVSIEQAESVQASLRFSLGDVVADENDKPTVPPADDAANPKPDESDKGGEAPKAPSGGPSVACLIEGLRRARINLPDDTTPENFIDRLYTAVEAITGQSGDADDDAQKPEDDEMADKKQDVREESPAYAALSLEVKATKDQASVALSLLCNERRTRLEATLDRALEQGKCDPERHKRLRAALGSYQLSLKDGAVSESDLEREIAILNSLPAGAFWTPEQRTAQLSLTEHQPPGSFTERDPRLPGGELDATKAKEIADNFVKVTGGR